MPPAVAELVGVERDECAATYATVSELAASGGSVTSGDVVGAMEWKGYDPDHVKTSLYGLIDLGVIELASDGSISLTRN
jgi:hypothetical protein